MNQRTLGELGELRLLSEVVLPLARHFDVNTATGDDCAFIEVAGVILAATGDVGPRPVIQNLAAHRDDWEAAGWLAVVATASDVASAGARPLFLTNCVDAPADLTVAALAEFMRGYFRAMAEFGFQNGGGDLRQGPTLLARVFGVAVVENGRRIGRAGASAGDHLVVIGGAGRFMADFVMALAAETRGDREKARASEAMRFPRPQLVSMQRLVRDKLVVAASDTSDGLLGAIDNIARASGCGFHLSLDPAKLAPEILTAAAIYQVASPWNIFFAWGDWSVAAIVPADRMNVFVEVCQSEGIEWRRLGHAKSNPGLTAELAGDDEVFNVRVVRNENFLSHGFNAGIGEHLDFILRTPLLTPRTA